MWPGNRTTVTAGTIYDCTIRNGYAKVNGTEYTETSLTADKWSSNVGTFKLASINSSGNVSIASYGNEMTNNSKWYACQLWDNGYLVRNLIPALDSSGVPCMYDTITKQPFYNKGSGKFGYKLA